MQSHGEIDVSHPEFFKTAKQQGYVPPNSEVFCSLSVYSIEIKFIDIYGAV